jgi:hypothetical protein
MEVFWVAPNWIQLAQDRNRWRALLDRVTNIRIL